jgi:hypothetical protein
MPRVVISAIGMCLLMLFASGALAGDRVAYVDVVGAPGDGEKALARALSERLLEKGFELAGTPEADAYEIQGMVRMSPASRGEQTIRIDWTVFGPGGTLLGNVTQVREIRKGSLGRTWGAAADAAAEAAAQDILKLLQSSKAKAGGNAPL